MVHVFIFGIILLLCTFKNKFFKWTWFIPEALAKLQVLCNGVENGYLIKLSSKLSIKLFLQFTENCINLLHMHAFMKSALSWMTATHANQLICNIWISFYRYINLTLQIKWALCNSMWLAKCYQLKGLE